MTSFPNITARYRPDVTMKCTTCGKAFKTNSYTMKRQCSLECAQAAFRERDAAWRQELGRKRFSRR